MPERRAHPSHQLADSKGLVDEIVSPEVEGGDFLGFSIAGGQNDDRHVGPFANPGDHLHAVHVGKTEVENDDVGRVRCDFAKGERCAVGFQNGEVVCLESGGQKTMDGGLVIHHKNARCVGHGASFGSGNLISMRVPPPRETGLVAETVPP